MSFVSLGIQYFVDPTKGKPVSNGFLYVGEPDLDPTVPANQKEARLRQENGIEVTTSQPISLGAGGVPVYNGSPVQVIVDGDYSLTVLDKNLVQVYYVPSGASLTYLGSLQPQRELHTATDGQTLFTMTTFDYVPGANDIAVYIDGRRQYSTAYTETSSTSVTFTEGLAEGQVVLFTSNDISSTVTPLPNTRVLLADLKAFPDYESGQIVQTAGRTAINDGGGGTWVYTAGNFTSEVAADTLSGLFAAADDDPTGLSGCWVRQYNFPVKSDWFGIYQPSLAIDYSEVVQYIVDQPSFEFKAGFKCTAGGIQLKSNTTGNFRDAVFVLPDGVTSATSVFILGELGGAKCDRSIFYGGIVDGNKANQTYVGSGSDFGGGDGGCHGIFIYNASNVIWENPKARDCWTDGIIAYASDSVPTDITNVHFHNPLCEDNSRQGISVVTANDMHFYNATCRGSIGKLPESGIDIEGSSAADDITVYFHGRTVCSGNNGRGFQLQSVGSDIKAYCDDIVLFSNAGSDAQFASYVGAGSGTILFEGRSLDISAGTGIFSDCFTYTVETPKNTLNIGDIIIDGGRVLLLGITDLDIKSLIVSGDRTSSGAGVFSAYENVSGFIHRMEVTNTDVSSNAYPFYTASVADLSIGELITSGSRGVYIASTATKQRIRNHYAKGSLLASALNITSGVTYCECKSTILGTLTADVGFTIGGSFCQCDVTWLDADATPVNITGEDNVVSANINRTDATNACLVFGAASVDNTVVATRVKNVSGTAYVSDSGTNNIIAGSAPVAINTP